MSEYERSRTMPALPEHVYDQAAQVDQLDSRPPEDLHVRAEELPAVTRARGPSRRGHPALLSPEKDQMRVERGTREQGRCAGWLQVAGIGSGPSEVTVHLSFFDETHGPGKQAVDDVLDRSLRRLEEQVRLRGEDAAG